jgi:uncharacterized protein (DUF1501 family)
VVVVFLRGGADGLTLVPPVEDDDYHRARPLLRVTDRETVPLEGPFGLHPSLEPLLPLWQEGRLSIHPAAGSDDDTRSHFEAQDLMEHGGRDVAGGWLGRWVRVACRNESGALPAVAFGTALPESLRAAPGALVVRALDELSLGPAARLRTPLAGLYTGDPLLGAAAGDTLDALDRLQALATGGTDEGGAGDDADDAFSASLRDVARLLRADVGLKAACVDLPGWDSHALQPTLMEPLMRSLGRGLAAFATDLGPRLDRTSVVVMTEFGRRVAENSALGTDHGRGGTMMVIGGGTPGGIRGTWPGLRHDTLEDPGDLPVANDYRDILADVLERHAPGVPRSVVFPATAQGRRVTSSGTSTRAVSTRPYST